MKKKSRLSTDISQLEKLVVDLDSQDIELEAAFKTYEHAVTLADAILKELREYNSTLEILTEKNIERLDLNDARPNNSSQLPS